jgi:Protein of unknown function (DUF3302)
MSGLDLFAWIVLAVIVLSTAAVACIMGWLPGHIARGRSHPWAQAVAVAGWVTLLFGFVLWPVAFVWAYVDVPSRRDP